MTNNAQIGGETIRVRGLVQGVGFRPTVWRLARDCGLVGAVWNDAEGVLIHAWGTPDQRELFLGRLHAEAPPLARIERIERQALSGQPPLEFTIVASREGRVQTGVVPDAASCGACLSEVMERSDRRYRYPFTNCTHCGPRLSIVRAIPYDRQNTSMAPFIQCPQCQAEYQDPADRRFHAQPNACPVCGPRLWLEDESGLERPTEEGEDAIVQVAALIRQGAIIAIKGIGGVHLACDAGNHETVERLRIRKRRYHKAFALMARDLAMVRRYVRVDPQAAQLLQSAAAPILVLDLLGETRPAADLAPGLAPGQNTLGFMLPYTPLHHLLMQALDRPIVLTSGNRSDEPQCIGNDEARERLRGIADYWLLHDRAIVNRLDDSVQRIVDGQARMLRRARGYAPAPLALPPGFEQSPPLLAYGAELKNTFCLMQAGQAIVSQHMGDLEDLATHHDYRRNLQLYRELYDHSPALLAVDRHPDYLSTQWGREEALVQGLPLVEVQHHHAHIAACMGEYGLPLDSEAVLGVALDGLGFGADGSIWGGEFLKADYRGFEKIAGFPPVAMIGGAKAMYEPWRNTYAHLRVAIGWERVQAEYGDLDLVRFLAGKPVANLNIMLDKGLNCPPASSAGRLFDAVAAAIGICRERAAHEGQAAIELEALADPATLVEGTGYGFSLETDAQPWRLSWQPLWAGLLDDLREGTSPAIISSRFHLGLARAVVDTSMALCRRHRLQTVVLSGGVFQNRLLLELCSDGLRGQGLRVLSPSRLPANDGGVSFGQALVAAARYLSAAG